MDIFRDDVRRGRLPQVSWIVAPEAYSEHPNWEPDFGSWYVSQVIDILASNPDVWSKMALFITYDEEGGFFDHMVPPTPPQSRAEGRSTVATTNEIFAGDADHPAGPYGLGVRVPMLVVSPWSRGGWVNSQLFDHTSLIRFLEARFGHHHRRSDRDQHHPVAARGRRRSHHRVRLQDAECVAAAHAAEHRRTSSPRISSGIPTRSRCRRCTRRCPTRSTASGRRGRCRIRWTRPAPSNAVDGSFRIEFRNTGEASRRLPRPVGQQRGRAAHLHRRAAQAPQRLLERRRDWSVRLRSLGLRPEWVLPCIQRRGRGQSRRVRRRSRRPTIERRQQHRAGDRQSSAAAPPSISIFDRYTSRRTTLGARAWRLRHEELVAGARERLVRPRR